MGTKFCKNISRNTIIIVGYAQAQSKKNRILIWPKHKDRDTIALAIDDADNKDENESSDEESGEK